MSSSKRKQRRKAKIFLIRELAEYFNISTKTAAKYVAMYDTYTPFGALDCIVRLAYQYPTRYGYSRPTRLPFNLPPTPQWVKDHAPDLKLSKS